MSDVRFSIVTPSFNQGPFLEETIRSIIDQDYKNVEYFVIDGGSTDQSVDIIKKYENEIDYWVSEQDRGQSHAINKGLARASGNIFIWINSDDVLMKGALRKAAQYFMENPNVDVVHGKTMLFASHGRELERGATASLLPEQYLAGMAFPQPSAFIKRTAILKVCPQLDEALHYGMDFDLFANLFLNGEFLSVPDVFSKYRLHPDSKTVLSNQFFAHDWQWVFSKVLKTIDRNREFVGLLKEIDMWHETERPYKSTKSFDRTFVEKAFLYFLDFQVNFYYRDLKFPHVRKIARFLKKNYPSFYKQRNLSRLQVISSIPFAQHVIPFFRKESF